MAAGLIADSVARRVTITELRGRELLAAIAQADTVGARGGAIYDYLHLCAARKAHATELWTLNGRHFEVLAREGDPLVKVPRTGG